MKSYTDREQSHKLEKILPIESADSHYVRKSTDFIGNHVNGKWSEPKYGNTNSKYAKYVVQNFSSYEKLPCWSLAALLDVIPVKYVPVLTRGTSWPEETDKYCAYIDDEEALQNFEYNDCTCFADNPIDAVYELILILHEQKLL